MVFHAAKSVSLLVTLAALLAAAGCQSQDDVMPVSGVNEQAMTKLASFDQRPTGVEVSRFGRVFVSFPNWLSMPEYSVAELTADGLKPIPDLDWNQWDGKGGRSARLSFVCVQSITIDDANNLWVLDPASPAMQGTIYGGPKLVQIDLSSDEVVRVISFDEKIAPEGSYLNDVRVDSNAGYAYITDSNLGALVVVDLNTGAARRVLENHESTGAEQGYTLMVRGQKVGPFGKPLRVGADGIAMSHDGQWVYYHALTGRQLYRIRASALQDDSMTDEQLGNSVEFVGQTPATDGMKMGRAGNLYLTAIEHSAIVVRRPSGDMHTVAQSDLLAWPDCIAIDGQGNLLVAVSSVHTMFPMGTKAKPGETYPIVKIDMNRAPFE